ncbi:MAG: MBL fold metallo-hydrolase [Alphaproteobacteria bacterium]|nr:MBL fold metallo-hydrolase [Alphaproteobacteria bacterium]
MINKPQNTGFFWQPLGGNNIDQYSGHCYHYFNIEKNELDELEQTSILIDLGKFDNHQAFGIENSSAAIPDVRNLLAPTGNLQALFITHSHPDHLNGILHYLKAGYKLPPLYAGKYTFMILDDLLKEFGVAKKDYPVFNIIESGDKLKIGSIEIETIASSHTCFDSLGFILKTKNICLYHTGDMKIDNSTYFRKPTDLARLKALKDEIKYVVADFCQVFQSGYTPKESDTFNKMVSLIEKSKKQKILIPVYPTHPEMYLIAFLSALKTKKNVVFYGNKDFYTYLNLIIAYGISFSKMAENKIKVLYKVNDEIDKLGDDYVVIGTFNDLHEKFSATEKNCFGIITAKTFFNHLCQQLNEQKIKYVNAVQLPELQGYGHGFIKDYQEINRILEQPTFIPTHAPAFVIDNFRELAEHVHLNLIEETPLNNSIYNLLEDKIEKVWSKPAKWLIVIYQGESANLVEVFQTPTAGKGNLKNTTSKKRNFRQIRSYLNKIKKGEEICHN